MWRDSGIHLKSSVNVILRRDWDWVLKNLEDREKDDGTAVGEE